MFRALKYIVFSLLIISFCHSFSQTDTLNKKRLKTVIVGESALYGISMTGLYLLWYKDYPSTYFHFFNDNNEWNQMDKAGHATTAYYIGKLGMNTLKWAGVPKKKQLVYGGSLGFVYLTTIEVFDAFSQEWGFSWGDMIANASGTGLLMGQELAWGEQRITMKYSFHRSEYWQLRPGLLGENLLQNALKDYNGQTYWLSLNLNAFLKKEHFPKWLNVALGYGANGMISGFDEPVLITKDHNTEIYLQTHRTRSFYFSLDVDLTRVKTQSKVLKTVFNAVGFIKIPFPAVSINSDNEFTFHPVYF